MGREPVGAHPCDAFGAIVDARRQHRADFPDFPAPRIDHSQGAGRFALVGDHHQGGEDQVAELVVRLQPNQGDYGEQQGDHAEIAQPFAAGEEELQARPVERHERWRIH